MRRPEQDVEIRNRCSRERRVGGLVAALAAREIDVRRDDSDHPRSIGRGGRHRPDDLVEPGDALAAVSGVSGRTGEHRWPRLQHVEFFPLRFDRAVEALAFQAQALVQVGDNPGDDIDGDLCAGNGR